MADMSRDKLITVFGGSGFVGRHVVRALARDGWRIRVAVRHPNLALFLRPMGRVGQIQLLKCDVKNEAQVRAALEGADACVNLVGVLVSGGEQNFTALHWDTADRIARAAHDLGVARLVHVSALGVSAEAPASYFRTKAAGEAAVQAAFPQATILRPAVVFGPEDDFFNRFGALARLSPVLPLIGGGATRFQPVFVGDVALAVAAIVNDPATAGRVFEAAGPEIFTFKELLHIVLRETRRKRLLVPLPFSLYCFWCFSLPGYQPAVA